jgi:hypothetical protein
MKKLPYHNWAAPFILGYEYKLHWRQGIDWETMKVQYSDPVLTASDNEAIILHFNHTERAEDFNLTGTYSGSNPVEQKTTPLVATDTSIQMGDHYYNNVTRHFMIKLDHQQSQNQFFTTQRFECITVGGCNGDHPEEGEIEETIRYWSKEESWEGRGIPKEDEEVEIKSTWNMVLDVEVLPRFKIIEINGRLTVENKEDRSYLIESYLIFIRKGELIVGTEDERFKGQVEFRLHGTRADKDVYFHDRMFEGGNKVIANSGKLRMYGKLVAPHFTRLAVKATAGTNYITVADEPTDWKAFDQIGIFPSGRNYQERDYATIQSISGNKIYLTENLNYTHFGAAAVDATKTNNIDIRTEVVHLTRNIRVVGTDEDRWGAHIVSSHFKDTAYYQGDLVTIERKGHAIIDSIELYNCSQYDTDKA